MPRTIEVTLASNETGRLLSVLDVLDGVLGVSLQQKTSLQPPGDVVTIHATNEGGRGVLAKLSELDLVRQGTIITSEPQSLLDSRHQGAIDSEGNEGIWDEMAFLLRRQTNLSFNFLSLMFLSGCIAAVGLWSDKLHLVIGAMVLAPGFEPILRVPFGLIAGPRNLAFRGLLSMLWGYLALAVGAAVTAWFLASFSNNLAPLGTQPWVQYWTTLTGSGIFLGLLGGAAGAIVITSLRSVLTAGVMITLALIPGMATAGMSLALGDTPLALLGLMRWAVDVFTVLVASSLTIWGKQIIVHKRPVVG